MALSTEWKIFCVVVFVELLFLGLIFSGQLNEQNPEVILSEGPGMVEKVDSGNTSMNLEYYWEPQPGPVKLSTVPDNMPYARYTLNSAGLREIENYSESKPEDVHRIGLFGDSFIWGMYVNDTQVASHVLEEKLNRLGCEKKIQVINFGVNGYDNPYQVKFYLNEGRDYNLDTKMFFMKTDDITEAQDILIPKKREFLEKYAERHGLESAGPDTEAYYTANEIFYDRYREKFSNNESGIYIPQVHKPMNILDRAVERDKSVVIVNALSLERHTELYREAADRHGFRYFAFSDIGDKYGYGHLWSKLSFSQYNDVHPNVQGNQYIADMLYVYLVSNNLINCG